MNTILPGRVSFLLRGLVVLILWPMVLYDDWREERCCGHDE